MFSVQYKTVEYGKVGTVRYMYVTVQYSTVQQYMFPYTWFLMVRYMHIGVTVIDIYTRCINVVKIINEKQTSHLNINPNTEALTVELMISPGTK